MKQQYEHYVGYEILIQMDTKNSIFRVTPCSPLKISRSFGGT
jgi:hypothetical protein